MFTILIVDDHPAICFALKVLLEKEADFTVVASNGERLLPQVRDLKPDLVILDIDLTCGDGMSALPRIKQNHPDTRVLMLTAQSAHLYAQRACESGADGFINKQLPLSTVVSLCQLLRAGYQCFPASVLSTLRQATRDQDGQSLLARFSDRELTVLRQLRTGKSNKEIADMLSLSNKTISTYKMRMLEKSGAEHIETLYGLLDEQSQQP